MCDPEILIILRDISYAFSFILTFILISKYPPTPIALLVTIHRDRDDPPLYSPLCAGRAYTNTDIRGTGPESV